MSSSRFGLVVFDLDGTLVDSRRDLAESANAVLDHYGCLTHSEESIGRMVGDGAATLVRRAFMVAGCPQPADALDRFLSIYNRRLLMFTQPYDGIPELLADLSTRAVLAVCTNKPLEPTQRILDGLALAPYFGERVIGGDGPLPRKPDPAGLRFLIGRAGVAPEKALLVGDSIIDWETGHAASAQVCMARYGFGFEGFPQQQLTADDRVVDHPRELAALV